MGLRRSTTALPGVTLSARIAPSTRIASSLFLSLIALPAVDSWANVVVEIPRSVTAQGAVFALAFEVPSQVPNVASAQFDFAAEATNFRGVYDNGYPFRFEDFDVLIDGLTFSWDGHALECVGARRMQFGIADIEHFSMVIEFLQGSPRADLYIEYDGPDSVRLPSGAFRFPGTNGNV